MVAKIDNDKWIRCKRCGHKLGRMLEDTGDNKNVFNIEIKCHSCKEINVVTNDISLMKEEKE